MKKLGFILILLVAFTSTMNAQKYVCKAGNIRIYGHTNMEDIEAKSNQAASVLDGTKGEIAFQGLVKGFKFERALMEEHFNENYMESGKFPKVQFKGTIKNPRSIKYDKDGVYPATVEGDLTIHGATKKISAQGTIEVKAGKVMVLAKFNVAPVDYGITIPSVVRDKIAPSMEITVDCTYDAAK
ncbi:MAG: hypothetical protein RIS47_1673 [Bacteroidota bacterium]|jgi:hypothetical protein